MTRLPEFLVIGAMKSGSTTVWEDLRAHSGVAMADKELGPLHPEQGSDERVRATYEREYRTAPADARRGEVCTTYSMLPNLSGVVDRAERILGSHLRIVYIVRHPVDRIVSHHHHDVAGGKMSPSIDVAVREDSRLVDYTRYATQLEPWVSAFGAASVHVVNFESYVRDRENAFASLCRFLQVNTAQGSTGSAHNVSEGKPVALGRRRALLRSRVYQRGVRPLIPENLRRRSARRLLSVAPTRPAPPTSDTLAYIREQLTPEVDALRALKDLPKWWDLGATSTGVRSVGSRGGPGQC